MVSGVHIELGAEVSKTCVMLAIVDVSVWLHSTDLPRDAYVRQDLSNVDNQKLRCRVASISQARVKESAGLQ